MQAVWGAILAGEINQPGSISKKSLSILADLEKEDLEAFERLCARCIGGTAGNGVTYDPIPLLIGPQEPFVMDPDDMDRLGSAGIIDFDLGTGSVTNRLYDCSNGLFVQVGETTYALRGDSNRKLPIPYRPLTKHGRELAKFCTLGNADGYADALVAHWMKMGFEVGTDI